jgi:hypothetical protein
MNLRFKARNAHHAYSGHPPAQASSLKRQARHTDRIFPNHQARCALLIPLRFEFANESRPRTANDKHPPKHPPMCLQGADFPVSVPIRLGGVTLNRGNNVAALRRSALWTIGGTVAKPISSRPIPIATRAHLRSRNAQNRLVGSIARSTESPIFAVTCRHPLTLSFSANGGRRKRQSGPSA